MASFGRGAWHPLPFLGCQSDALISAYWGVASRTRVESAYCHILRSIFTTTEEKEIDHGVKDKLYFLAFGYDMPGRTTGLMMDLMMDSGDDVLHTVPCFEDDALPHTMFRWIWLAVTFLSI